MAAAPVLIDTTEPDRELLGREHRVEAVDQLHDHRLGDARRFRHRIDGHAVVDPARRVALEQEVRQRRQQHAGRISRLPDQTRVLFDIRPGDPADQKVRDLHGICGLHPIDRTARRRDPDLTLAQDVLATQSFASGLTNASARRCSASNTSTLRSRITSTERIMFRLGLAHPQHVVEEQLLGVGRCEPAVFEPRAVHHHLAKLSDL